LVSLCGIPEV